MAQRRKKSKIEQLRLQAAREQAARNKSTEDLGNSRLANLINEAKSRQAAANKKVSRLKRVKNVTIAGTTFDPRKEIRDVVKMNRQQLQNYVAGLNRFLSRNAQFEVDKATGTPKPKFQVGHEGTALPQSKIDRYLKVQNAYNAIVDEYNEAIAHIKLPGQDMAISDMGKIQDANKFRKGWNNKPFEKVDRNDFSKITSPQALDALTKQLEKRLNPTFLKRTLKEQRTQMDKMLKTLGYGDLQEEAQGLNDFQFNILWNHTEFQNAVSNISDLLAKMKKGDKKEYQASVLNDYGTDIKSMVTWAKKQNPQSADGNN